MLAAGGGLTAGARPAQDWPLDNRVSATVRLQAAATPQDLERIHATWRRIEAFGYRVYPVLDYDYIALPH